ncbi:MAG: PKD domain-containing protein, partial [Planctomycetota bacterium]
DIVDVTWDFDDGESADGESATHSFGAPGTYEVTVTYEDEDGNIVVSDPIVITVSGEGNVKPTADVVADVTAGDAPLAVSFDGSASSDSDGSIASYSWDFDDDGTEDATGATVDHTYTDAGSYVARLTVTDDGGLSDDATVQITVAESAPGNRAPTASINQPDDGDTFGLGTEINFRGGGNDPDGDSLSWSWDFDGDGTEDSDRRRPNYTYTAVGTFEVTLTVSDGDLESTDSITLTIADMDPGTGQAGALDPATGTITVTFPDAPDSMEITEVTVSRDGGGGFSYTPVPADANDGATVYLPIEGTYDIVVTVGGEEVTIEDVTIDAGDDAFTISGDVMDGPSGEESGVKTNVNLMWQVDTETEQEVMTTTSDSGDGTYSFGGLIGEVSNFSVIVEGGTID